MVQSISHTREGKGTIHEGKKGAVEQSAGGAQILKTSQEFSRHQINVGNSVVGTCSFNKSKLARDQLGIHGSSLIETYPKQDSGEVHGKHILSAVSKTARTLHVSVFDQYSESLILSKDSMIQLSILHPLKTIGNQDP